MIGLQKGDIGFSHPAFHKQEGTLMSSRNATKEDFHQVITAMTNGSIDPVNYITTRMAFDEVIGEFPALLHPETDVIKAMIMM